MEFNKAKRQKQKVAALITGASGSGKTIGALYTAFGIVREMFPDIKDEECWEKVAVIDTEHERSLYYAGMELHGGAVGEFMHMNFEKPYSPDRLIKAMKMASEFGAVVVIVDSLTHFWNKEGGVLDIHQKNGGQFQHWKETNKDYDKMVEALVINEDLHIIATGRSKQDVQMIRDEETGKASIKKFGMKSELRDSMDYEFAIVVQPDHETHICTVMKDNSGIVSSMDQPQLSIELGKELARWADKGEDVASERRRLKESLVAIIKEYGTGEHRSVVQNIYFANGKVAFEKYSIGQLQEAVEQLEKIK